jgi:hypothetical protein
MVGHELVGQVDLAHCQDEGHVVAVHCVEEAGDQLGMTPVVLTRTEIVSLSSSRSPRSAMQPGSDAGAERIGRDCHERRGSM